MIRQSFAFFFVVLLCAPTLALAANFYVDPSTGSNSNNGSSGSPWKTIEEVISSNKIQTKDQNNTTKNSGAPVNAGDTIYLRSGNHGEIDLTGYFNDSLITIRAQSGHTPTLSNIQIRGGKNWRFQGLRLRLNGCGGGGYVIRLDDHNWHGPVSSVDLFDNDIRSIDDSTSFDSAAWNSVCGGIRTQAENSTIRNNHLENVDHGIVISANSITVEDNEVDKFAGDGMVGGGSNIIIRNNRITNNFNVNGNHDDGIQFHKGVNPCNCNDVQIIGNVLIRNTMGPNRPFQGALQGVGLFDGPYNRWLIMNNVVLTDHYHGISGYTDFNDSVIKFNTVFGGSRFGAPAGYPDYAWIAANGTNNIVSSNFVTRAFSGQTGVLEISTIAEADAHFVDWRNFDMRLKPTSSARGAGDASLAPLIDIVGTARGNNVDIGAYEYTTIDNLSPNAPGNLRVN